MQKMVLKFRKQLCMNLLYHPLNRINLVEFRKKLGITLKRKLPGILDLTIEGESSESEAAVIIETENRDDKTPEDEHISVEKEQGKKEEHVLSTDTKNDEASSPSDEERQPSEYENMYDSFPYDEEREQSESPEQTVYEKMDDSKGSLSPEKEQGGEKKSSNEKKEVGQRQHVLSGYDFSSVWQEACACKHKFYLS